MFEGGEGVGEAGVGAFVVEVALSGLDVEGGDGVKGEVGGDGEEGLVVEGEGVEDVLLAEFYLLGFQVEFRQFLSGVSGEFGVFVVLPGVVLLGGQFPAVLFPGVLERMPDIILGPDDIASDRAGPLPDPLLCGLLQMVLDPIKMRDIDLSFPGKYLVDQPVLIRV